MEKINKPIQLQIETYIRENHGTVTISKTKVPATSNIDKDLNQWANDIASAVSQATGNNKFGRSTVINEALRFYRHFFSRAKKMIQNKDKIASFIDMLD